MRPSPIPATLLSLLSAWLLLPFAVHASYFEITAPSNGTQWVNGQANPVTWKKGLLDGITSFDVELARLSQDGLLYAAKDVPADSSSLNIFLQDVPAADDYFLLFLNSTHGVMYTVSDKFSVVASGSSVSSSLQPAASAPTVSIVGGPNPTNAFSTTFPPSANGVQAWAVVQGSVMQMGAVATVLAISLLSGALAVL
ncbi:hypothetical protein GLOTRDRAFT_108667 [Gloeophyllum trabeum ATCC 11539]|uniref:Uncharacterized protein n=1 Tax=Gloeophyllum trabeum (strain ATCC 11539 / FP-39264 / Madison 617) TaxID=670483 RepID=S7R7A2_GLOTA|nr:uncharacterized protein GLOTRDRAFT_108667 [Gloeophyllum trabeum ATCC 11539]EPQ50265.1 hypothetical protein GLOTRDRAFT_108667 [Gloeophyllum trabeum ATCC 11539]